VIDGHFMAIEQAMGTPKRNAAGAQYLRQFIEEMKKSGFYRQRARTQRTRRRNGGAAGAGSMIQVHRS